MTLLRVSSPAVLIVAAAFLATACRHAPPSAIDPAVAASIPAGTRAFAGIDAAALRQAPLYSRLSQTARAALDTVPGASHLYLAWNGTDLLILVEGPFTSAPPGYTLVAPHLAAGGSVNAVSAAQLQHKSGHTGVPGLLDHATSIAPGRTIWIAAAGDAALPLPGNFANLNRLLRYTRYTTAAARIDDHLEVEFAGICADTARSTELEEKLHAFVSLIAVAAARRPALAAIANAVHMETHADTVRANLSLPPDVSRRAIALLTP